jgi:RHS repeat-associated protein
LGSNREVTSYAGTTGTVVQQTEYYPSGTAYVEGTGAGIQPFKFTGKELIIMHGLNWQDFGARWLDNVRMQWTTMDPLCEKYYAISPYTYCSDDPAKNIDPDGRADYFSPAGKFLGTDNDPQSNNIRIITPNSFNTLTNGLEKSEYSVVASSLQDKSVSSVFSQADMTDKASLNVYGHYNTTGLPLKINNDLEENVAMQTHNTTVSGKSNVEVNVQGNKNDSRHLYDNVNNVKNTFAHEKKHRTDFINNPQPSSKKGNAQEELKAIDAQKKDPTYKGTTDAYKQAVNKYEDREKNELNK